MNTANETKAPASSRSGVFALMFSICFAIFYVVCEMGGYPMFTFHPGIDRIDPGFVRDTRGSPVVDAQVVLQPKKGKPASLKSNVLGLYRGHISKDVLPDDVQISCVKAGYKQTKINRRTPPGNNAMFIETECTMQRL